ncbi:MAG: glycosyltransferase [Calditrichaeota bacterium]|nr:glycosyltransferase [Calditrichota bacterium]MCB9366507.1 glycosyltransferase [Calditrichota bacterium]
MRFSIVVISFNQLDFIKRLTSQLLNQGFPTAEYEIVLVECASTDGTCEWLSGVIDSRMRPLVLDVPSNRSFARNRGIEAARGDIVVMVDGDHTVQDNFLEAHWKLHEQRECAVVGKSDFAESKAHAALNAYLNGGGAAKLPTGSSLPGRYFLTRNCSVPKRILLQIGMFDESFDRWGGEDLDLGVRIENAGVPIYASTEALAIHHHFRSLDELMTTVRAYGRDGVPLLLRKHPRLFRELNLDRSLANPFEPNRTPTPVRALFRVAFLAPVYWIILAMARMLSRVRLPRSVLDYLHLRQYTIGFMESDYYKSSYTT